MHILHIYKDYHPVKGGIENLIKWMAEAHVASGHQVDVLVASLDSKASTIELNGVDIHKIPRFGTFASVPLTPTLPFSLQKFKPDILHIHSPYPPGELFGTLLSQAKYRVLTYHSDVVRQKVILQFYKPFLKWVLNQVDVIMPSSQNYLNTSPFLAPHHNKCQIIPFGIDLIRFNKPIDDNLVEFIKVKFGNPLLLFVGRLRYYKGLDTLIEAVAKVPDANLLIVGTGPMKAELVTLVNQLNLGDRVHFAGDISDEDLPTYYQAADCFILPSNSRAEAFGIVLLEALAAGLPLITTELGTGTSFVNLHNQTGFVVPPNNPIDLAEGINTLLKDSSLRQKFAQAALNRAKTEFTKDVMVKRVEKVYNDLVNR